MLERTVIGTPQNQDALVAVHPIDFVQEVAPEFVRHQAVEILQDKKAGGGFPGFLEDSGNREFGRTAMVERLDVERRHRVWTGRKRSHDRFDADCFAVTGRAMEDDPTLLVRQDCSDAGECPTCFTEER